MDTGGTSGGAGGHPTPLETARYIAEVSGQMSSMARKADLEMIAYLLDMTRLEAEETVQKQARK